MVRRSVETQRRQIGTARMRQLHQETAGSTNGYQRRGDHHVDLDPGRAMGTRQDHDGGDRQGKCHDYEHGQESRISRAHRYGEQDDRDEARPTRLARSVVAE